jgi:hypothetical protein
MKKEETLSNSFYEALVYSVQNQRVQQTGLQLMCLRNKVQKVSVKYQQTEFNNTPKRSYTMTKLISFHGCKYGKTCAN